MKNILSKASEFVSGMTKTLGDKMSLGVMSKLIKTIIIGFLVLVVLLVGTFYGAWLYLFIKGKAMLGDLLNLIDRVISPQMVAFITFISTCFVDKDGNDIPDRFEHKDKGDFK